MPMYADRVFSLPPDDLDHLAEDTDRELRNLYHRDNRPWVVAFSGGKDSTLLLQLVCEMLQALGPRADKPIFVISSDTRVEAPNVSDYLHRVLDLLRGYVLRNSVSLKVRLVEPSPAESFWGKLIGQGYPSPTRWFRWCTSNMKIKPARRAIEAITRTHGSVILLLGTRREESSARGQRIRARETTAGGLNPHHEIPDALVATPIVDWTTDEVWEYLARNDPPPWGGDHGFLFGLYRQAAGGECPVVLDLATPSCGGSRFGCWTCTVVKEDKSLQGFIESGEDWMRPLNAYRNRLKKVREKENWRAPQRRDGSNGPGPFLPGKRRLLLRKLLELERQMDRQLISDEEILYIQKVWAEEFDLEDTAIKMAAEFDRRIVPMEYLHLANTEHDVLRQTFERHDVPEDLIRRLLYLAYEEYRDLNAWGAKESFKRDVKTAIDASVGGTGQ